MFSKRPSNKEMASDHRLISFNSRKDVVDPANWEDNIKGSAVVANVEMAHLEELKSVVTDNLEPNVVAILLESSKVWEVLTMVLAGLLTVYSDRIVMLRIVANLA